MFVSKKMLHVAQPKSTLWRPFIRIVFSVPSVIAPGTPVIVKLYTSWIAVPSGTAGSPLPPNVLPKMAEAGGVTIAPGVTGTVVGLNTTAAFAAVEAKRTAAPIAALLKKPRITPPHPHTNHARLN